MEAVISAQTAVFLYAAILGMGIGLLYDLFRSVRIAFKAKGVLTAVCDLLFCFISFLGLVYFMLTGAQGQLRGYILLGMAIGAALYFCALSDIVIRLLSPVAKAVKKLLSKAQSFVAKAFDYPRGC